MQRLDETVREATPTLAGRPRALYVPCAICKESGVAAYREGQPDIPARYCACPRGRQRQQQAEQDFADWLTWRRGSLMRRLDLPKEADGHGLKLSEYTIGTYRKYLAALELPPDPEYIRKALDFLDTWDKSKWLLLWGTNGNGKTGLMICLVKLLLDRALSEGWDVAGTRPYEPQSWHARFIRSLDFIHKLQDGFDAEKVSERTGSIRAELEQAPLLAFDDFGKGHFTPWVMQEYSSLFDYRAMAGLPTFVTTNLNPKQMREQFGDYLIGRMLKHVCVVRVNGVDTRFMSALLENPDLSPEDLGIGGSSAPAQAQRLRIVGGAE